MKKKYKTITIIYGIFLDHSSTSAEWETLEDFNEQLTIEDADFVGFLEKEDSLAYYLSTMRLRDCKGSGHTVIKSTLAYVKKISFKVPKIDLEHIKKNILVETPMIL